MHVKHDLEQFCPRLVGRIAVDALLDVAAHQGESGAVSLASTADRIGVSLSYLEQIFARLRRAGIVISIRGPGGGYRLARPADEITIAEIVAAAAAIPRRAAQTLAPKWEYVGEMIRAQLASITLADLQQDHIAANPPKKFAA